MPSSDQQSPWGGHPTSSGAVQRACFSRVEGGECCQQFTTSLSFPIILYRMPWPSTSHENWLLQWIKLSLLPRSCYSIALLWSNTQTWHPLQCVQSMGMVNEVTKYKTTLRIDSHPLFASHRTTLPLEVFVGPQRMISQRKKINTCISQVYFINLLAR